MKNIVKITGKTTQFIKLDELESVELDKDTVIIRTLNNIYYIEFDTQKQAKSVFEKLAPFDYDDITGEVLK